MQGFERCIRSSSPMNTQHGGASCLWGNGIWVTTGRHIWTRYEFCSSQMDRQKVKNMLCILIHLHCWAKHSDDRQRRNRQGGPSFVLFSVNSRDSNTKCICHQEQTVKTPLCVWKLQKDIKIVSEEIHIWWHQKVFPSPLKVRSAPSDVFISFPWITI